MNRWLRPMSEELAEVKRMYAHSDSRGNGTQILSYLEQRAKQLGYRALRLETRLENRRAVSFYEKQGYSRIPNYGRYEGRPEAVCFEKRLPE
ncbi:MAG TPA: GNAT family N-acetyltransferase [Patescibacteria group bacterium]|nr:GNAT family N-acetyltransferase [Patescibacteria group bacterium]